MLAVLPVVAAVALAPKVCSEPGLLRLVQVAADLRPPAVTADGVREGVQVQVNVAVRVSAQAAAVESAHSLAAQLRCRGDVEEVLTEGVLQIHRQVGAAGLAGGGGRGANSKLYQHVIKHPWKQLHNDGTNTISYFYTLLQQKSISVQRILTFMNK